MHATRDSTGAGEARARRNVAAIGEIRATAVRRRPGAGAGRCAATVSGTRTRQRYTYLAFLILVFVFSSQCVLALYQALFAILYFSK